MKRSENLFRARKPVVAQRCVHLDLKGLPPTPKRLLRLLKVFAAARYNSVLVEWEDMFPWKDERLRCETAYSPAVIRKFVRTAEELGMELIPLVQCFGHMETPLRLRKYAHLRADPLLESNINPLDPRSRELVAGMMDEVLALMPGVKRFHLGGDEADYGNRQKTKKYIATHSKGALYMLHIDPLLNKLIAHGIRPLLWDDMMRNWNPPELRRLGRKADLVFWGYSGILNRMSDDYLGGDDRRAVERFLKHGIALWAAPAYKGADGYDADLPKIDLREKNILGWLEPTLKYKFTGMIVTAWSRHKTGGLQNEPIEGALDSAFNSAVILHDGKAPDGGIEACWEELNRIGEGDVFRSVRNALSELSEKRNSCWAQIRKLRQFLVSATLDSRSEPSYYLLAELCNLLRNLKGAEKAASSLGRSLNGMVEHIWVKRYIAERIEPLREEAAMLEAQVRQHSRRPRL